MIARAFRDTWSPMMLFSSQRKNFQNITRAHKQYHELHSHSYDFL